MQTHTQPPASDDAPLPSWSACIATLNRHDVLMVALTHLTRQTCPPAQIIVVDASENWEDGKAQAEKVLEGSDLPLIYVTSPVRSSATQRNLGISLCTSDIVFLLDDDSFLHDDCGAELMAVYAADPAGEVAGVGALLTDDNPAAPDAEDATDDTALNRKESGRILTQRIAPMVLSTKLGRWINREVLLQSASALFMRYDEPREAKVPASVAHLDVSTSQFMPGSGMSFRRRIGALEQFDTALRYYAAFEDLDIAYRIARHGAVLSAHRARLHHFEAASGRIKRQKVIAFQLLNTVIFLKRHAKNPEQWRTPYRVMLARRFLSEFLKDGLSQRWRFPQVAGVRTAMRHWREVWAFAPEEIDARYPDLQRRILEEIA